MKLNDAMKSLLKKHSVYVTETVDNTFPVHKTTINDKICWCIGSTVVSDISYTDNLSELEWHCNEVHMDAQTDEELTVILKKSIAVLNCWKRELETKYSDYRFCILMTYDNGEMLVLDDDEIAVKSLTLRFWSDRGNSIINLSTFDKWEQPAIVIYCNY